jgi:predicted TIM-barrel fold metal-dependent hydrolase
MAADAAERTGTPRNPRPNIFTALTMKTIAIEEHFITPMYRDKVSANEFRNFYLSSRSKQIGHDIVEQNADLGAERLRYMDAAGVDVQVLSFGSPGPQAFNADIAIPMARDANDRAYDAVRAHPKRFAAFAALPTADAEESAKELDRCVTKLGFKGAMIHGHTHGSFLDERKYWVIFEAAHALDVPIYLHPTLPHPDAVKAYFQGYEDIARAGWGFAVDTSCHFLRIVFAGVFDAYPKLKIILGHLGEDNLLVTTSGNWFEPAFLCTMLALGVDNILFAIDWPYEPNTAGIEFLKKISISDTDREKIAHGNAERILRLEL